MVEMLKRIGETMGFGNAMWYLSALWSIHLKERDLPEHGAFVPTILFEDDDYKAKTAELEKTRQQYIKEVKKYLKSAGVKT